MAWVSSEMGATWQHHRLIEDLLTDYREIEPTVATRARLVVIAWPKGLTPGVAEFTVFGHTEPAKQ